MAQYENAMGWVDDLFHLFGREAPPNLSFYLALAVIVIPIPILVMFVASSRPRQGTVPPYRERVVILGASSGVGEELALQYSSRGCRNLVLVARRRDELEKVRIKCEAKRKEGEEWEQSQQAPGWEDVKETVTVVEADCTKPEDLIKVRQTVRRVMGGLDTLHIVYGASALRSLLNVAGVDPLDDASLSQSKTASPHATLEGVQAVYDKASKIHQVNAASTAAVLAAFIPLLQLSSASPAIVLLSSAAALFPPPTRSLYAASKAAQLQLFLAAGIEADAQSRQSPSTASVELSTEGSSEDKQRGQKRRRIRFFALAPATIRTSFRLSALDGPPDASSKDSSWDQGAQGTQSTGASDQPGGGKSDILEASEVAFAAIKAADRQETGVRAMPAKYRLARWAYLAVPSFIDAKAQKKYGYGC
ncbi:unnamed protein product [Parajaminaea phylloscopi]